MAPFVPQIKVIGSRISSNAVCPRSVADVCAMWAEADRKRALRMINSGNAILCEDATAYAAAVALNLQSMLRNHKYLPLERIVKHHQITA